MGACLEPGPRTAWPARPRPAPGRLPRDRPVRAPGGAPSRRRDGADEPPQSRCDGEIGKPAGPDVKALTDQDLRSVPARRVRRLLHEAGLADPCLAPHDHEPRDARRACVDLPNQGGDITIATDKHRARDAGGHGNDGTAALKVPAQRVGPAQRRRRRPIGTAPRSSSRCARASRCTARVGDHRATRVPFGPPDPPKRE